ncbi:MAG: hypothetical protein H7Z42_20810, partial [Roseiflexaceae bacterium]|nr:hypothetical protein [Roseiflexaceae bacterium]
MRLFGHQHTRPSLPRPRVLQAVLVVLAMLLVFAPSTAAARPRISTVQGTFQTQVLPPSACPPPGLGCARGIVTGGLAGDVSVNIDKSEVIVDTAGVPFSRYSGTITIVTAQG